MGAKVFNQVKTWDFPGECKLEFKVKAYFLDLPIDEDEPADTFTNCFIKFEFYEYMQPEHEAKLWTPEWSGALYETVCGEDHLSNELMLHCDTKEELEKRATREFSDYVKQLEGYISTLRSGKKLEVRPDAFVIQYKSYNNDTADYILAVHCWAEPVIELLKKEFENLEEGVIDYCQVLEDIKASCGFAHEYQGGRLVVTPMVMGKEG